MKWSAGSVAVLATIVTACNAPTGGGSPTGEGSAEALRFGKLGKISMRHANAIEDHADAGATTTTTPDAATAKSCIGSSLMQKLGRSRVLVGATMADSSATAAPWDFRYLYIAGGLFDSSNVCSSCASSCTSQNVDCSNNGPGCPWWGCWQSDQQAPGQFLRDFLTKVEGDKQLPMITYDTLLEASGVPEGTAEATEAATNVSFMTRYFADFRFMLQQIGSATVFLHLEPDFWGYAQKASPDPHAGAAVASADPTDCGAYENSIAGMGQCMIAMTRKYAPNALVGLHGSPWGTGVDCAFNSSPTLDVAAEAKKTAAYLVACGADKSDFIVVEASDRDAGYYDTLGSSHWWDATNATLPSFHQDLAWLKSLAEGADLPLLDWQMPIGNMSLANTSGAWHDNRVDYFFGHMDELAAAHVFAIAYGAGASGMTTPETDNGNIIGKEKAYAQAGGQLFCP